MSVSVSVCPFLPLPLLFPPQFTADLTVAIPSRHHGSQCLGSLPLSSCTGCSCRCCCPPLKGPLPSTPAPAPSLCSPFLGSHWVPSPQLCPRRGLASVPASSPCSTPGLLLGLQWSCIICRLKLRPAGFSSLVLPLSQPASLFSFTHFT